MVRKTYNESFKAEACRLVTEQKYPKSQVCRKLGVRISVLIESAELERNRVLKATPFNVNEYIATVAKTDAYATSSRPAPSTQPNYE